jgi:acyl-CoA synthetase (AMP-forming)/AMP-acid ligase II
MCNFFYIDPDRTLKYDELLERLNNTNQVIINMHKFNTLDFLVNFIAGITSNLDLILLDNDFSLEQISEMMNVEYKKKIVEINTLHLADNTDLLDKIKNSKSKITLFSSGTSGKPKPVKHSIESLIRSVKIKDELRKKIWGLAYNPTHMAGIQVFFQCIFNKNTIVNLFDLSKSKVLDYIEKFEIEYISSTPSFFRLITPSENKHKSVIGITLGGESSDTNLYDKIKESFPNSRIRNIYASTEGCSILASENDKFKIPKNLNDKIKILDNEIIIHESLLGESVGLNIQDNWYKTGDVVEFVDNTEGTFRIIKRRSDSINIGGYKVDPSEIEFFIKSIDSIHDVKVYGIYNSVTGNILCADVVRINSAVSESMIKKILFQKLQNYKIPRKIIFKDKIEINRVGKKNRSNVEK